MAELLFQSKQEKLPDGSPIIITKILGAIDGTTVRQFEDKLIGFFNQGVKNLVLIFSDVKYINSTGMGLLVKLADKFQEGGGDIKLVGVPEKVIALFDMLGLLSLFKIYDTEEDAVDSIAQGASSPKQAPKAATPPPPPPANVAPTPAPAPPPPPQPQAQTGTVRNAPPAQQAPPPQQRQSPVPTPATPKPTAHPAPQRPPAPQPPQDDFMGGGIEIGGGIQIGGEEVSEEPLRLVSFPYEAPCSCCTGVIQFSAKGNFRCPRCGSFLSVNEYGQQTVFASISSHVAELKCPCDVIFSNAAKEFIHGMAQKVGFSNIFCEEVDVAIEHSLSIVAEKKTNNVETYQLLVVADANEMIIGVKSLNPFLVQGGPKDARLPLIARKVDRLEVFPLPNKGQLLKMTKKRK